MNKTKKTNKKCDLWLIVDFDDVINKTTLSDKQMHKEFSTKYNIPEGKINEMYEESKIINKFGKKVFRPDVLIKKIKNNYPSAVNLEKILRKYEKNNFIDQAVRRALISVKKTQPNKNIKISILTFGDIKFQKRRIENSKILKVVDDVIYTESSKKEAVERLSKKYSVKNMPFVITVDDHPRHVDDLAKLKLKKYLNIRFSHPQGKHSKENHKSKNIIICKNALDIFRISVLAINENAEKNNKKYQKFAKFIKQAK